jgi:hypothetical protein
MNFKNWISGTVFRWLALPVQKIVVKQMLGCAVQSDEKS